MSIATSRGPARRARSSPALVSITASSRLAASISSQPTQRAALPQASTSEPSEFQMRMKASPLALGSMPISWSQPTPRARSAMARAAAASGAKRGRSRARSAPTTTKSLPRPFILRNG